jgi:hypothetical protein
MLLMPSPSAAGSKRGAPSAKATLRQTKKQKGSKPKSVSDTAVEDRGKGIGMPKLPNELLGMTATHGDKRMFLVNMKFGCKETEACPKCSRGLHICCVP